MATIQVNALLRGLNRTAIPDLSPAGTPVKIGWSNNDFSAASPLEGDDPIELMLKFLISTGATVNYGGSGKNYDNLEASVGLGIPQDLVDIASFEAIQADHEYDTNQRVFFHFKEPAPAKKFIEEELCTPFGWFLITGNDGRIKLRRPKHPQKFHIGAANRTLSVKFPSVGGSTTDLDLTIGVYTAQELEDAITTILATIDANFACAFDTGTHKFTIANASGNFDLVSNSGKAWETLGWTSLPTNVATTTADEARGYFDDTVGPTLSKNDLWDIAAIDNREDQIASVIYEFDYDVDSDAFTSQREYADAETVNLGDILGEKQYVIKSKGLISAGTNSASSFIHFAPPSSGCTSALVVPNARFGVDDDTWAKLYAFMLLDRYKQPPMKFKAKLKWEWNHLEVGDVVRIGYDIAGVFADAERNASTLTNRLFEIVELQPNYQGFLDVTFLGHRYVSY